MTGQAERRHRSKLHNIARGRADAWIAAERYMTPREHAAFAVDLALDRHDMHQARRRAADCADESPHPVTPERHEPCA